MRKDKFTSYDESTRWQAHAGVVLCTKEDYDPYSGLLVIPGSKTKHISFRVRAIGEGVEGYEVGDLLAVDRCFDTPMGSFVREQNILGKLSIKDQRPDVASRARTDVREVEVEKLIEDMAAAD
jgi:hypothetical protein